METNLHGSRTLYKMKLFIRLLAFKLLFLIEYFTLSLLCQLSVVFIFSSIYYKKDICGAVAVVGGAPLTLKTVK